MARIPYPDRAELPVDITAWLRAIPQPGPVGMLAHSAPVVRAWMGLIQALFGSLALAPRTREIVTLATAVLVESEYELVQHVPLSEAAGIDEATRAVLLRREFGSALLSEHDRATARFVAAVIASPSVPEEVFEPVRSLYNDREIVEIMQVVGFYWSLGRFLTVLDIEIAIPEGTANFDAVLKLGQANAGSVATPVTAEGTRPDRADR
jgi:alkylhydroperoxidase family enzyme